MVAAVDSHRSKAVVDVEEAADVRMEQAGMAAGDAVGAEEPRSTQVAGEGLRTPEDQSALAEENRTHVGEGVAQHHSGSAHHPPPSSQFPSWRYVERLQRQ